MRKDLTPGSGDRAAPPLTTLVDIPHGEVDEVRSAPRSLSDKIGGCIAAVYGSGPQARDKGLRVFRLCKAEHHEVAVIAAQTRPHSFLPVSGRAEALRWLLPRGARLLLDPHRPVPRRMHGLSRFVVARGGEYAFMPGLRALRWLAEPDP